MVHNSNSCFSRRGMVDTGNSHSLCHCLNPPNCHWSLAFLKGWSHKELPASPSPVELRHSTSPAWWKYREPFWLDSARQNRRVTPVLLSVILFTHLTVLSAFLQQYDIDSGLGHFPQNSSSFMNFVTNHLPKARRNPKTLLPFYRNGKKQIKPIHI